MLLNHLVACVWFWIGPFGGIWSWAAGRAAGSKRNRAQPDTFGQAAGKTGHMAASSRDGYSGFQLGLSAT